MKRKKVSQTHKAEQHSNTVCAARPKASAPQPMHALNRLHRTLGNQAVGHLMQAKLRIGRSGDKYEQEADQVAGQVMRMPDPRVQRQIEEDKEDELAQTKPIADQITPLVQRQIEPEEEEGEEIQAKLANGRLLQRQEETPEQEEEEALQEKPNHNKPGSKVNPELESRINAMKGRGQPLPESTRSYFEQRFGHSFSNVRVHTNKKANETTKSVDARAFTIGRNVVFGAGQYGLNTDKGKKLLAHELTHVIQQNERVGSMIQYKGPKKRRKKLPGKKFKLEDSKVADLIRTELTKITIPSSDPKKKTTVRVDPGKVIKLLSSSALFLEDAEKVKNKYFTKKGKPRTTPPLTLRFHEKRELGSEFERSKSLILVHVTTLPKVVERIVHEIVHARHATPKREKATGKKGAITRAEEAGVREEATTRERENEIMAQITASEAWTKHTGGAAVPPALAKEKEVRESFISGFPKLTYQEFFIIGEMKSINSVAGVDEEKVRPIARKILSTHLPLFRIEKSSVPESQIDVKKLRKEIAATEPDKPIYSFDDFKRCVRRKDHTIPGCSYLLDAYRHYFRRPLTDKELKDLHIKIVLKNWKLRYEMIMASRESATSFLDWYKTLPKGSKRKGRQFFEWVLIEEAMYEEWSDVKTVDPAIRGRHLDFLAARIGKGLKGISRP
ncbi:MAG: DUF4157 domain-containing protein [Deltaproteobacteria bacterium]|nr:DUF4157 domain-containing protein [Deltaproteobacteria bacterium]MBL7186550.1 DUF4157 domain-containing protein [Phycisphaerae bacterium]